VTRRLSIVAAVTLVAAIGLTLRLVGLRYGLPAVYNPDEVAIVSRALAFAKGDPNPHNFLYPTLYFYVLFAWVGLAAVWSTITGAVASFGDFQRQFFVDPTRVYVAARLLSALAGTATIVATWALARRIGGELAGIAAALFVAVAPLHVRDSHYVKHDVPVTLLIVLAYLAYDRLWRELPPEGRQTPLIAAAVLTGAAFSTHYYTIFLAIPLAWSAARGARTPADVAKRVAIAAAVSAAVFFLLSPFILVEPATAWRDIRANRAIVVDRAVGSLGIAATAGRYADMLWHDTAGWPVVILALSGLAVLAWRQPARAAWLLAFPLPFLLFIATTFPATRYLIPLVPFLAIFAALAIAAIAEGFFRLKAEATNSNRVAAAVIAVAAAVLPVRDSVRADRFFRETDTRTLAADYIRQHVPAGSTILTQPYSVELTPTAASLEEAVRRSGRELPTKTRFQIGRSPYPSPAYRLLYLGEGLDADKIYVPYGQLGGARALTALGAEHVAFVVLKRYNEPDPATTPFLTALAREGRRLAVFSPYGTGAGDTRAEPFLHNTGARIDPTLARPGPVMEIWQLDDPGS
jgi:hypothetical protein